MRCLYFDCFSGISGDMVLGALIDLGIEAEDFKKELEKLHIDGYSIKIKKTLKNGISCTDVDVILEEDHDDHHTADYNHAVEHNHTVDHNHAVEHNHAVDHNHAVEHNHAVDSHHPVGHQQRNLSDIERIIDGSVLSENVKNMAKLIFRKLADAEAKVHGKPVEQIHFHEVGAVDSIIDIVGTAICIDRLNVDRFTASPVNTGMGFVKCQHGVIPVPGPATVELLKNALIYSSDIQKELVTPTGAAILSSLCTDFGPIPLMKVEMAGYGSGKNDAAIPSLLRVLIGNI